MARARPIVLRMGCGSCPKLALCSRLDPCIMRPAEAIVLRESQRIISLCDTEEIIASAGLASAVCTHLHWSSLGSSDRKIPAPINWPLNRVSCVKASGYLYRWAERRRYLHHPTQVYVGCQVRAKLSWTHIGSCIRLVHNPT